MESVREDAVAALRVWNKHYYGIWKGVLLRVGWGWAEGGSNF
jgi:hypothetical protein